MDNVYLKKLPQQGFATIKSSLQQFVQHPYRMQHTSIFWGLSGEALFSINGHKHRFMAGDIIICPTDSSILLLDITSDFSSRMLGLTKHIWLASRSEFSSETMHSIEGRPHKGGYTTAEKEFVSNIFRQIELIETGLGEETINVEYARQNIILSVNALLLYINFLQSQSEHPVKEHVAERKDKVFYEFRRLLSQKFREERSVHFYAENMNVSTRHLNAICQKVSGQNAKEIIDQYTIIELQVALMYTHKSFQELVNEYHFPDQSYLNRYFKRHTGFSLSEFRIKGVMPD